MAIDSVISWGTAEVVASEEVAEGVRRVVLAPDRPVPARPGSHVDIRLAARDGADAAARAAARVMYQVGCICRVFCVYV